VSDAVPLIEAATGEVASATEARLAIVNETTAMIRVRVTSLSPIRRLNMA
jgi:hypothetical protein